MSNTPEIAAKLREHYHKLCRKENTARQEYDAAFESSNSVEKEDEKRDAWMMAHAKRDEFFDLIIQIGAYNEVFPSDDDDG